MSLRFGVMALCALYSLSARADSESIDAKKHFQSAEQHYTLGEFHEALKEFKDAYRLKQDPRILFNLGQTSRQLGQYKDAAFYYRQYLTKVADPPNRDQVQTLLEQTTQAEKAEAQQMQSAKPAPLPAAAPPAPASEEKRAAVVGPARVAAPPSASKPAAASKPVPAAAVAPSAPWSWREPRHVAGLAGAGVGVVLLGVSAYEGAHGRSLQKQAESGYQTTGGAYAPADLTTLRSGNSAAKTANILLVTAAILLAAGITVAFVF